jgi:hypothetical protein
LEKENKPWKNKTEQIDLVKKRTNRFVFGERKEKIEAGEVVEEKA